MASAKSSRSRPAGHSGVFPVNAAAGAGGGDGGVQLADKLKIFKTDNFDPDAYVQSKCRTMDEKVRNFILPEPEIGLEWWSKGRVLFARSQARGIRGSVFSTRFGDKCELGLIITIWLL
jgi:hypothetical protein